MRRKRRPRKTPAKPSPRTLVRAALCLLLLLAASASGEEFSAPTILRPPSPDDLGGSLRFGSALALDRATLAVLAKGETAGTVYFYERHPGGSGQWNLASALPSSEELLQVHSLALEGDTLVAGARNLDTVFVFNRSRFGWYLRRVLRPPGLTDSAYGSSVAVSGQRIAVGAPEAHRVLIHERNARGRNVWGKTATLRGDVTAAGLTACFDAARPLPGFGASVALSGETLAVGAFEDLTGGFDAGTRNNGSYVFQRDRSRSDGWRPVANVAQPSSCSESVGNAAVSLSGPNLLWTSGSSRWAVYERNRGGPDRWGRRMSRPAPPEATLFGLALRGNVIAFGDFLENAAWVYERDVPSRNRWGFLARLASADVKSSTRALALGPREVVTGHPQVVTGGPPHSSQDLVQIFPRAPILADDFESGTTSAWSGHRGRVGVVAPGLDGTGTALAVTVGGDPRASFIASNRPRREPSVSLELSLLPNEVELVGRRVEILRLYAGKPALRLRLSRDCDGCNYTVSLDVRQRNGLWRPVADLPIASDEESRIAVDYRSATADGTADGFVRIADSFDSRQVRNLDTGRLLINRVVLGLPVGSPAAASGSFLIDNFEMHR